MDKCTIPEIRIALFGPSASGKTTLLASYFGNQQRNNFEENHGYRLEADDVADGTRLLAKYYGMKQGKFPLGTEQFSEFRFGLKVSGLPDPGLYIIWYDYPGGWWERTPKDELEKQVREDAFKKLLTSHVGILLIDGMRFQNEGMSYVCHLLDQFRGEARRILDTSIKSGNQLEVFPSQWILAISKADLLPPWTRAEDLCEEIVRGAADQINGVAKAVNSKSFGHQFLLLSSVRGDGARVVDVDKNIGLTLVAPIALISVLFDLAERADKGTYFGGVHKLLSKLSQLVDFIDKIDDFLPPKYQIVTKLLKVFELREGLNSAVDFYQKKKIAAVKKGKAIEAAACLMQAELSSSVAAKAYFKNQRG